MATSRHARLASTALRLERVGSAAIRYGLTLILVWIGALTVASHEIAVGCVIAVRPFPPRASALGGIGAFAGWQGHVLTDSGGYQVFSLNPKVNDDGVTFKSTYDGSQHLPRLPVLPSGTNTAALVKLTESQLTDGLPGWCPDENNANRYDVDLLRIRKIGVTIRVQTALAAKPEGADAERLAERIRSYFGGSESLLKGAAPKIDELTVAWAREVPQLAANAPAPRVAWDPGNFSMPLTKVGTSGIYAATATLAHGTAFNWHYESGATRLGGGALEVYETHPDSRERPGVPKGTVKQMPTWESRIFAGTKRD